RLSKELNMNRIWMLAAIAVIVAAPAVAQSRAVTHMDSEKVAAALKNGGSIVATKELTVARSPRNGPRHGQSHHHATHILHVTHRKGTGQVEVHDHEPDIFYVTDGEATLVTGGTMVGGKQTAPGQHRGTDIQGGQTQKLKKGDVVTIPAGVPHWFKDVSTSIS